MSLRKVLIDDQHFSLILIKDKHFFNYFMTYIFMPDEIPGLSSSDEIHFSTFAVINCLSDRKIVRGECDFFQKNLPGKISIKEYKFVHFDEYLLTKYLYFKKNYIYFFSHKTKV